MAPDATEAYIESSANVSMTRDANPKERKHAERYEKDLEVLANLGRLLAAQSGQRQMLTAVLDEVERKLGMIRGTIMLLSSDGSELFVDVARDVACQGRKDLRYRRGEGIVGRVVQTGQTAVIPRISQEPRFTNRIHRRDKADEADAKSSPRSSSRWAAKSSARCRSICRCSRAGNFKPGPGRWRSWPA